MDLAYYILSPFSWLLELFTNLTGGYGFALILFALVVKLILFPFSLKGKKSMIRMNMLSGKMQQIQKKYANDKERQNLEIQKLYEREKINPMGGCLWSLIPVFILIPLYAIIRQPLKYMMALTPDQISSVAEALNWAQVSIDNGWVRGVTDAASNVFTNAGYDQLFLSSLITPENLATVQAAVGEAGANIFSINFSFLGLDLSQVPQLKFWEYGLSWDSVGRFLIPIVSALTGLLFSFISMRTNQMRANEEQNAQQKSTNRTMMIVSPLMSLWIGFAMPAALGVYWIVNNLLSMLQEYVAGRILRKDYEAAAAARAEQERLEKEEEKKRRREAAERKAQAIAEAKANRGKKKVPVEKKKKGDTAVIGVSGVGLRAYARGRAYDPYRFSPEGPTPYKDPSEIDEAAVEAALEKKKKGRWGRKKEDEVVEETAASKALEKEAGELEQVAADAAADELIAQEILEQEEGEAPAAPEETAPSEEAWEEIDQEIRAIQAEGEDPDKKEP